MRKSFKFINERRASSASAREAQATITSDTDTLESERGGAELTREGKKLKSEQGEATRAQETEKKKITIIILIIMIIIIIMKTRAKIHTAKALLQHAQGSPVRFVQHMMLHLAIFFHRRGRAAATPKGFRPRMKKSAKKN